MTDKEFIYNFLDKTYEPIIDGYGFMFRDKIIGNTYNTDIFKINFYKIIGSWVTDDGSYSIDYCVKWFEEKKINLVKDLDEYLNFCTFELGITDWIVKNNKDEEITLKYIIDKFCDNYSEQFITNYYGDWYSQKVCEYSEEIMKQW